MFCVDPMKFLMNDLPAEVGKLWVEKMQCQPATEWADVIQYCSWTVVPSVFLITMKDMCIPVEMQLQGAKMAGSEIVKCDAGHMIMLSQPEKVIEIVRRAAGEEV